jgi:hypothetical protein
MKYILFLVVVVLRRLCDTHTAELLQVGVHGSLSHQIANCSSKIFFEA